MPQRNRSYRSRRYQLVLALACGFTAMSGCSSGVPEMPRWRPTSTPVPFTSASTQPESPAEHFDNPAGVVAGGSVSAASVAAASVGNSGVRDNAVELGLVSNASLVPEMGSTGQLVAASHLIPAEPVVLQEPETVAPPTPKDRLDGQDEDGGDEKDEASRSSKNSADDSTASEKLDPTDEESSRQDVPELVLDEVVASVRNYYPKIREAVARQAEASGQITTALGGFDLVLDGHSINQPLGFYENYRHGVGLKQPLWNGGYASAGYRIGRGFFEPYLFERATNDGGEFKLGFDVPLLQGRDIDKRRAALRAAELRRGQTNPELFFEILMAQGDAAIAYWTWVSAGLNVEIQEALLKLARDRVAQFEERIKQGDIERFQRIDNDRLIASREIKLIDSQRKFGQSAVKLSLYLRDAAGMPVLPPPNAIPEEFPKLPENEINSNAMIDAALANRPETRIFQFDAATLRVELAQATNQLLPELNLAVEASQDVGGSVDSKKTLQPAKMEAAIYGEVPLQRRAARGKIDSLTAKLRQVEAKLQLAGDQIATEVQQILVARDAAFRQIEQAELNLELAEETLELGNFSFQEGDLALPILNVYEQAVADAQASVVIAKADFFAADALLSIAVGRELDSGSPAP